MNLTNTKTRLKGAVTGHSLLKKKADALTKRFRTILSKIDDVRLLPPASRTQLTRDRKSVV